MEAIVYFKDHNRFLSNFFKFANPILFEGQEYFSVENAYMSAKTLSLDIRANIQKMTPSEAKAFGQIIFKENLDPNPNWSDELRVSLVKDFVFQKFSKNPELKEKLLLTGEVDLIEGNYWHDNFFGICNCGDCPLEKRRPKEEGNHLGIILMEVREILREW